MKIKSYHVYLISMVALGMMLSPILASASYWITMPSYSNNAQYNFTSSRYGRSTATLQVREKYSSGYTGVDEIVSYSGSTSKSSWPYVKYSYRGNPIAGRGGDGYLYCYIYGIFEYTPGVNYEMLVKATTTWNDNSHRYVCTDFIEPA